MSYIYKSVFIILHYMTYNETYNCIESILKNVNGDYKIIVIDNASYNQSGIKLKETYVHEKHIDILILDKNLGFANGNNYGYKYAKEKYNPDFIICINNDTIIEQSDFLHRIQSDFENENFYVLGPDIISEKDQKHQNPAHYAPLSKNRLKFLISIKKIYLKQLKSRGVKMWINNYLKRILEKMYNIMSYRLEKKYKNNDIILHGACLIFSKLYIEKNFFAFFNKTFLYLEEDILHYICKLRHWKMVYDSEIKIIHLEDASTNFVLKTEISREIFKTQYFIDSGLSFLEIMKSK